MWQSFRGHSDILPEHKFFISVDSFSLVGNLNEFFLSNSLSGTFHDLYHTGTRPLKSCLAVLLLWPCPTTEHSPFLSVTPESPEGLVRTQTLGTIPRASDQQVMDGPESLGFL